METTAVEMRAYSLIQRICENHQTSENTTNTSIDMQRVIGRYLTRTPNPTEPVLHMPPRSPLHELARLKAMSIRKFQDFNVI